MRPHDGRFGGRYTVGSLFDVRDVGRVHVDRPHPVVANPVLPELVGQVVVDSEDQVVVAVAIHITGVGVEAHDPAAGRQRGR